MTTLYEGDYPVPEIWVENHLEDDEVGFRYFMSLADLIDCDGIEGMNDYLDRQLGLSHASLTDISYGLIDRDADINIQDMREALGNDEVLIEARGVLESW